MTLKSWFQIYFLRKPRCRITLCHAPVRCKESDKYCSFHHELIELTGQLIDVDGEPQPGPNFHGIVIPPGETVTLTFALSSKQRKESPD